MPGLTVGCDPELFVMNTDGEFVSAEGLIPGTKSEPYPVKFGAVQVDGMAAEFNIDPVDNYNDFSRNVKEVRKQLKAMLPKGYKRSEEHTSELQSLMRISYAVFCLKKQQKTTNKQKDEH